METHLLAVMLRNRDDYYLIKQYLNEKLYTREFVIVMGFIGDYYDRDDNAESVDLTVIEQLVRGTVANDKHADKFMGLITEASETETSGANVKQVILSLKQRELGQELAAAIANEKEHSDLLDKYSEIKNYTTLEELTEKGVEVYEGKDLDDLIEHVVTGTDKIKCYPLSLSDRLDGGLSGSDSMIIFGRPEMAKTALVLTLAVGFAKQGKRIIIFNNEERIERLRFRALCNASAMTANEVRSDPETAKGRARENGWDNLIFIGLSPGSVNQIDAFIERYKPDGIIVDQLRNLLAKAENRTNQLEAAAQGIRNLGKKHDIFTISVTQAGDSGEGKAVLEMGDVDNSNTGIPGACDVLLGIGATESQKEQNIRVLTLIKNKIGGIHDNFPVRFNQWISKYASMKES